MKSFCSRIDGTQTGQIESDPQDSFDSQQNRVPNTIVLQFFKINGIKRLR